MSLQPVLSQEELKLIIDIILKAKSLYDILQLGRKLTSHVAQKLRNMISEKSKKILLIGGGEIGTEIAIAAIACNWKVRAVVKEKPSPIINLPYYLCALPLDVELPSRVEKYEIKHPVVNQSAKFQYLSLPNFRGEGRLQDIADFIAREEPDLVLLEDVFLTPEEWSLLYQRTMELVRKQRSLKHAVKFIPPVDEITLYGKRFYISDIFLNKAVMKRFLATIGLQRYLLGLYEDDELINIDRLKREIKEGDTEGSEHTKIKKALERYSSIVLKPLSTSSGHGQFAINNIEELKQKIRLIEYLKYRVPNQSLMIEEYIKDPIELCVIASKTEKGYALLDSIYYEKYNPDEYADKGFEGQSRLMVAQTYKQDAESSVQHLFSGVIPKLMKKILQHLPIPYLYVEFIVDPKNNNNVYINELSYRPDDAGFISLASHKNSQFELFRRSLELITAKKNKNRSKKKLHFDFIEKTGEWTCATLVEYEKCSIPKSHITYETDEGRVEDHFKFRFYEKVLNQDDVPYKRIIGYQWHHKEWQEKDEGERILRMHAKDLGIPPELLERLVEALKKRSRKLKRKREGVR